MKRLLLALLFAVSVAAGAVAQNAPVAPSAGPSDPWAHLRDFRDDSSYRQALSQSQSALRDQAAAQLAESWHLPATLCEALGAHHDLASLPRESPSFSVAAVVATAAVFADIVVRGSAAPRVNQLVALFHDHFSLGAAHLTTMLKGVDQEISNIAAMLDVPLPPAGNLHAEAKAEMLRLALDPAAATTGDSAVATEAATPEMPKS
jgi:hypothetical protein